ncbi:MAG: CTP synthetase, partial [Alphaproteobacteria bacterium]|nr:CTP synthetase [Alphaproteobacteria bacterium]
MQMAVIETSRNLLGIKDAGSTEFEKPCTPVVNLMQVYEQSGKKYVRPANGELGSTKRIGAHPCIIKEGSIASDCYKGATEISERHRHHYEIDINLVSALEDNGIVFSGTSPDGLLPEIMEIPEHPFFIASQFQPEFKSRPFDAHPLFTGFIKATLDKKA